MEIALDECREVLDDMESALDRLEAVREKMGELFAYYGSEAWFEDREGELPETEAAGVLSEDLVYDEITELRDAAFQMLELASDILKNRL